MRRLRWEAPPRPAPKHPYRDSALVSAVLAAMLVGVTALTGGEVRRSLWIAAILFVVSTAYGCWRWRVRSRRGEER